VQVKYVYIYIYIYIYIYTYIYRKRERTHAKGQARDMLGGGDGLIRLICTCVRVCIYVYTNTLYISLRVSSFLARRSRGTRLKRSKCMYVCVCVYVCQEVVNNHRTLADFTSLSHALSLVLFLRPATRSIILRYVDMYLMLLSGSLDRNRALRFGN